MSARLAQLRALPRPRDQRGSAVPVETVWLVMENRLTDADDLIDDALKGTVPAMDDFVGCHLERYRAAIAAYRGDAAAALRTLDAAGPHPNPLLDAAAAYVRAIAFLDLDPTGAIGACRAALELARRARSSWLDDGARVYQFAALAVASSSSTR